MLLSSHQARYYKNSTRKGKRFKKYNTKSILFSAPSRFVLIKWDTVKFRNKLLQILAPQTRNGKNPPLNRPSKYKPPGGLHLEIGPKYKVKQSKNGKLPSNYNANPIDFETQISLHR